MPVYNPTEDSELLKSHIAKYAKGIVLDMGTGSGIQAEEAAASKKVTKVFAVDLTKESIVYCIKNIKNKKIKFMMSNLFSVFQTDERYKKIKFDTITFNPPYLPQDPGIEDPTLYGGKEGYEIVMRFLYQAKKFLKPKGKILLLFSSLTNKDKVEKYILKYNYTFKQLDKKHWFFEDLYIYLVEHNPKLKIKL